jgi:BASS family bile acid:Na+ symporter
VAQFLLLPALTFLLTLALDVRGSVALGMILVACCPPGNVSNILTHRAKGDVALSVSMTAVSNLLAIFLMPLNMAFWGSIHPTGKKLLEDIELDAVDMLLEIGLVIGVPFAAGITIARLWPRFASRAGKIIGPIAFLALGAVIVIGVTNNWDIFVDFIGVVLLAVFLHDALALLLGYSIARATRLPERSTKAMTFEVGIRNAGLGLLLVFTYFDGLGGMALVAAWWGIWDIIAGLAVAQWWGSRSPRQARVAEPAP